MSSASGKSIEDSDALVDQHRYMPAVRALELALR